MTEQKKTIGVELLKAISAAMGNIKTLHKGEKNTHDKYNFASIDNFLTLVNPICAKHGLIFQVNELDVVDFTKKGKYGESGWLRISYEIIVYHTSGQSMPPSTRSVEIMRNGAQAFGSGNSYVLKQFMRSLFLIPTGDKDDADYAQTDNGISHSRIAPKKSNASKSEATRAISKQLFQELDACGDDLDALQILSEDKSFQDRVAALPDDWKKQIRERYTEIKTDALEKQGV